MERIIEILSTVKSLAKEYKTITGKPLGVTGEIGENEVAKALKLTLGEARQIGFDAFDKKYTYQIKSRIIKKKSQRTGKINKNAEWDKLLLVLLDDDYNLIEIYESDRIDVIKKLEEPGSKARNEKHTLSITQTISISRKIWSQ